MGFITVNGRILDFAEHKKEVSALRFELAYEISECMSKYGFKIVKKEFKSYHCVELLFVNEKAGLVVKFKTNKD